MKSAQFEKVKEAIEEKFKVMGDFEFWVKGTGSFNTTLIKSKQVNYALIKNVEFEFEKEKQIVIDEFKSLKEVKQKYNLDIQ